MGTRGRKSVASLVVVSPLVRAAVPRLAVPADLSGVELAVWRLTVTSLPGGHFGPEQGPLLAAYCGHIAEVRRLRKLLRDADPAVDLGRYRDLLRTVGDEVKRAFAAARGLRLTNQSRLHPVTAGGRAAAEPRVVDEDAAIAGCIAAAKEWQK